MAKRAHIAEPHSTIWRGNRHLPVFFSDAGRARYLRRVATTTPNGNATTAAFDALNRVVTTVAPDTGKTSLGYDGQDNVTSNTDPVAVATQFTYDGFGDVIQEVSPDRGTSTYWYNAEGQLTQSSDGRGQVVTYTLDLLGRVTTKVPTGLTAQTVTYTWDTGGLSGSYPIGRLTKIVDGSGTTLFGYDPRGNLTGKQQKIGTSTAAKVQYAYDLNNRITQITYPSGRIVQYAYDTKGRVSLVQTKASSGITTWTTIASGYTYEPFGAVDAITLGNGLAVANIWGADGLLTSRRLYKVTGGTNLSYLTYTYDADSNIGSITDQITAANTVLYGYDKVDRLSMSVSASTTSTAQTYAYTSATNKLATLTTSAGARTYTYDGRGNTSKEVRPASVTATTTYDGYARLTGYTRTDVGAYTFTYNGLDDRVTMTNAANGTRTFVYDNQARVLGEYGASTTDVKAEYIWALPSTGAGPFGGTDGIGGYAPLAVATPNSTGTIQLNWVFGNHLGVPLVTTDSTGALATTPNNYFLPGFPGQSRIIADLYYNRYRDYDPTTGRYIQSDSIGLWGGSDPYAYAGENPLTWIDPSGLAPIGAPHVPGNRRKKDCPEPPPPPPPPQNKPGKGFWGCAGENWHDWAALGLDVASAGASWVPGGGATVEALRDGALAGASFLNTTAGTSGGVQQSDMALTGASMGMGIAGLNYVGATRFGTVTGMISAGSKIGRALPGISTAMAVTSGVIDGISTYQHMSACMSGGQ